MRIRFSILLGLDISRRLSTLIPMHRYYTWQLGLDISRRLSTFAGALIEDDTSWGLTLAAD